MRHTPLYVWPDHRDPYMTSQAPREDHRIASHPPGEPPRCWRRILRDGGIASVLSTLVVSTCSRHRTGSASAGTNAASQWLWYPRARFVHAPSWRHTVVGYLIHHACSVFWSIGYEATRPTQADTAGRIARAAMVAAVAYGVDYHVVPRRLSPGFEHKVGPVGMAAVYASFALGLVMATTIATRPPRRCDLAQQRQPAQQQRRRP
ncbi:conserved hypothetical protein [uncultured Stenotrophomonas sp.]|uniref:Transmembrane protein n=1 Tax=uncultured Stenotrophomonas sp. TaxID=165438 RepID=A0A1Y5Q5J9_9GAMM|nr:conserved hypothetical protein [uncultured Stenotrophomonas sp.]